MKRLPSLWMQIMAQERFAVVDLETTGGSPVRDRIVEIGVIFLENGLEVERFQTLVQPGQRIPMSVQWVHGINDEMVAKAPSFSSLADMLFSKLEGYIFVAHNAGFDFNFLKEEFARIGKRFEPKKVCTVRYSRKVMPSLKSHSLKSLCHHFGIENHRAHRALEDAEATALILKELLVLDPERQAIASLLKQRNPDLKTPLNVHADALNNLPESTGVYLFHDKGGKVVYVGKAKNLKERVSQHFSGQTHTFEKRSFLESIHKVTVQKTGHELMALLLENELVKQHFPRFNSNLKEFKLNAGIFSYTDQRGYLRLVVGQTGKWSHPLRLFRNRIDAVKTLLQISLAEGLCLRLNQLGQDLDLPCSYTSETGKQCLHCTEKLEVESYNQEVLRISDLYLKQNSLLLKTEGREEAERGLVWVEKGKIKGLGFSQKDLEKSSLSEIFEDLKPYYDTQDAQSILQPFLEKGTLVMEMDDGVSLVQIP